nr:T9SS type A sorting domain-containing protein [Breznakibacter xylanolyticus]
MGNGSIEVNGNSYSTPMMLDESQAIEIKAIPQSGWVFDAWSGDYIGTNSQTTITMDADKTIVAEFLFTTGLVSQNKKNNDLPFIQTPNSIKLITNEYVTVQLDGLTGQHILKTTNSNIDISMLRNGLYILTLTKTNGESQSYKIVKR